MAEQERSSLTRPILLIALVLPLALLAFIYLGTKQEFEGVPIQYDIQDGDTVVHTLPVFSFVNTKGETITQDDLQGKIVLMSFFSVDGDSLSQTKTKVLFGNLMRTYENVDWEKDPPFLFVSVNTGDSLAVVRAFAARQESEPEHWWFLGGNQEDVIRLGGKGLRLPEFTHATPGFQPFTSQRAALIDMEGRVRKYYVATDLQEERGIQEDLITLLRIDYPEEINRMRAE